MEISSSSLLGSVAFEQDIQIAGRYISEMTSIQKSQEEQEHTQKSPVAFNGYSFGHIIGASEKLQSVVRLAKKSGTQRMYRAVKQEQEKRFSHRAFIEKAPEKRKNFCPSTVQQYPIRGLKVCCLVRKRAALQGSVEQTGYFEEADGGTIFLDELN